MSILCLLFGHKSNENVYSGGEYMRATEGTTDGIGREHWTLYARYPRCDRTYRAGRIHGPLAPDSSYPGARPS